MRPKRDLHYNLKIPQFEMIQLLIKRFEVPTLSRTLMAKKGLRIAMKLLI